MEQRKSDFSKTYAHTWDLGSPAISMFEFTAAEIGFAQGIITKLFYAYAIADIQIIKRPITRTYLEKWHANLVQKVKRRFILTTSRECYAQSF